MITIPIHDGWMSDGCGWIHETEISQLIYKVRPQKKDKWHTNRLEKLAHNHSAQWSGRLNKSNHYYFVTTLSLLAVAFIQTYFTCDGKL